MITINSNTVTNTCNCNTYFETCCTCNDNKSFVSSECQKFGANDGVLWSDLNHGVVY